MDASNLLKPALARGELHCVGATTLDEYRKNVEKDAALARRFQPVFVSEPTVEDTISILRGLKEKYELHHGVRISDSAIVAAATLSNRYIADRFLPDKAIDLMDEAGSRVRMAVNSKPEELDEIDRRIVQLKIEREALTKETDAASKARLEKLEDELDDLEGQSEDMTARWRSEKEKVSSAAQTREALDRLRAELVTRPAPRRPAARLGDRLWRDPDAGKAPGRGRGQGRPGRRLARGGRRRADRRRGLPLDRRAGRKDAGGRAREAAVHGGRPARPRGRPGGGPAGGLRRRAPRPRRPAGPQPPDRLVPVPGPHGRRQDRAHQGARRIHVRRRARDHPPRHERIHGEALGQPDDRRASGLRRLRRGRGADRGRAPPALPGRCCSTRSRRPTPTSSTCCCRCWTTAG